MHDTAETAHVHELLDRLATRVGEEEEYLTELDSLIGDGDFGVNLHRGLDASVEAIDDEDGTVDELVATVGRTLVNEIGGSSGVLLGMATTKASTEFDDHELPEAIVEFAITYRDQIAERGDVSTGQKTLYDVLVPVVDTLEASADRDLSPAETSASLVEAARRATMYTAAIRATRGRASYTELRSVGHPDPGAVGLYIMLQEIHEYVQDVTGEEVKPRSTEMELFSE